MFVPPPIALSRAQIEQQRRRSSSGGTSTGGDNINNNHRNSAGNTSSISHPRPTGGEQAPAKQRKRTSNHLPPTLKSKFLHPIRRPSPAPPRQSPSPTPPLPTPSRPPPPPPARRSAQGNFSRATGVLAEGFAERPRRAPAPPLRHAGPEGGGRPDRAVRRPGSELFLPPAAPVEGALPGSPERGQQGARGGLRRGAGGSWRESWRESGGWGGESERWARGSVLEENGEVEEGGEIKNEHQNPEERGVEETQAPTEEKEDEATETASLPTHLSTIQLTSAPPPPLQPPTTATPPPIPARSSRRPRTRLSIPKPSQPLPAPRPQKPNWFWDPVLGDVLANVQVQSPGAVGSLMERSWTAPPEVEREFALARAGLFSPARAQTTRSLPAGGANGGVGAGGVGIAKVLAGKIGKVTAGGSRPGAVRRPGEGVSPERWGPWKKRRRGETMSTLLDRGFFLVQEFTTEKEMGIRVGPAKALTLDTSRAVAASRPVSILATPTSMYSEETWSPGGSPRSSRGGLKGVRPRGAGMKKRTPLAQIPQWGAQADSGVPIIAEPGAEAAVLGLEAILEHSPTSPTSRKSSTMSSVSTPLSMRIQLRSGSVVTVAGPEATAWQRRRYVQGPIKLPEPAIIPRKGSLATLDPFQDAIDQRYQKGLAVPRRRSDDAITEDICGFFEDYGFTDMHFDGDLLAAGIGGRGISEIPPEIVEEVALGLDDETFSTPPSEPEASPIKQSFAKELLRRTSQASYASSSKRSSGGSKSTTTGEALGTKEIARLSGGSRLSQGLQMSSPPRRASVRRDSEKIRSGSGALMVPGWEAPDATRRADESDSSAVEVREADQVPTPGSSSTRQPADQGFDWDDEGGTETVHRAARWVAPAAVAVEAPKKAGSRFSTRSTPSTASTSRNPLRRMRRLMTG